MRLTFRGRDSWERPVYEDMYGKLYCDVDPRPHRKPDICTKQGNEFDGEPLSKVESDFIFEPCRDTWGLKNTMMPATAKPIVDFDDDFCGATDTLREGVIPLCPHCKEWSYYTHTEARQRGGWTECPFCQGAMYLEGGGEA